VRGTVLLRSDEAGSVARSYKFNVAISPRGCAACLTRSIGKNRFVTVAVIQIPDAASGLSAASIFLWCH
jgi:hypothetical protein